MSDRSAIEWTDASWNPIRARNLETGKIGWHCEHASEGCRFCFAERFNHKRLGTRLPFKPSHRADIEIFLDEKMLLAPLRWRQPRRIFVGSMTDLFGEWVPDAMLDSVFAVMALAPRHTFQVLTKRPARMLMYFADPSTLGRVLAASNALVDQACEVANATGKRVLVDCGMTGRLVCAPSGPKWLPTWPLPNVWLGTSCEDQATADIRVPVLLATPAAVRFVSAEPLLGPINFSAIDISGDEEVLPLGAGWLDRLDDVGGVEQSRLDWIITGGESGPDARPMHPAWARSIRDQCAAAGVPFFFKQWGEWSFDPDQRLDSPGQLIWSDGAFAQPGDGGINKHRGLCGGGGQLMQRVGKRTAGRRLDGVTHDAFPEMAHG